jgi:hypothetical protein
LITFGLVATLAAEGTENSRMVLVAMLALGVEAFEGMRGQMSTKFIEEGQNEVEPFSRVP